MEEVRMSSGCFRFLLLGGLCLATLLLVLLSSGSQQYLSMLHPRILMLTQISNGSSHGNASVTIDNSGGAWPPPPAPPTLPAPPSPWPAPARPAPGPSIVCSVVTVPYNFNTKTRAVRNTWSRRCDYRYFVYTKNPKTQPIPDGAPVDAPEGRGHLTEKSHALFAHAYSKHNKTVDWYLKCDDDSYFIVENLKYMLSYLDPDKPYYLGEKISDTNLVPGYGYHSGGAGYVLSREAARRLVQQGKTAPGCVLRGALEDVDMGKCMKALGVTILAGIDSKKMMTFHSWNPMTWLDQKFINHRLLNYRKIFPNYPQSGREALSYSSVSFHYVKPQEMYMYDFLIYDLCLSGKRKCTGADFPWVRTHSKLKKTK